MSRDTNTPNMPVSRSKNQKKYSFRRVSMPNEAIIATRDRNGGQKHQRHGKTVDPEAY
jgi:hypothetical protein